MKKVIIYFIAFGIMFLSLYSYNHKNYDTPQKGTLIGRTYDAPCIYINRPYAALYERPDKTRYYYCTQDVTNFTQYHIDENGYITETELSMLCAFYSVLILCVLNFLKFMFEI